HHAADRRDAGAADHVHHHRPGRHPQGAAGLAAARPRATSGTLVLPARHRRKWRPGVEWRGAVGQPVAGPPATARGRSGPPRTPAQRGQRSAVRPDRPYSRPDPPGQCRTPRLHRQRALQPGLLRAGARGIDLPAPLGHRSRRAVRGGWLMNAGTQRLLLILSWLWLLAVGGYMIWSTLAYEGIYRWLAEWQMEQWGQYYRKATAVFPFFILGVPALAYLGRLSRARHRLSANSMAAQVRSIGRGARITFVVGLVGIIVGGTAFWLAQGQPDGSEDAVRFDLARLGSGPVPETKVRIEGRLDPEASTGEARGGVEDTVTYYAAFRAGDGAKGAPVRRVID